MKRAALLIALAACSTSSNAAPEAAPPVVAQAPAAKPKPVPPPAAPPVAPKPAANADATAKAMLDTQIAALEKANRKGFTETFAPTGIVALPQARSVSDATVDLAEYVSRAHGSKVVKSVKASNIVAGSAAGMTWFSADLALTFDPSQAEKLRTLELVDGETGRVPAAQFGDVMAARPLGATEAIEPATDAGPLAKLLTSPADVAAALSSDPKVVVQGTDPGEYAVGPAKAKVLLKTWSKLKLSIEGDKVHEVRTKSWGYVMAVVNYPSKKPYPYRLAAFLIAVPSGDKWQVVALHYAPF